MTSTAEAGPSRRRLRVSTRGAGERQSRLFVDEEEALYSALLENMAQGEHRQSGTSHEGKGKLKGKSRATLLTDTELALRMAREEAQAAARFDADRAFALRVASNIDVDSDSDWDKWDERSIALTKNENNEWMIPVRREKDREVAAPLLSAGRNNQGFIRLTRDEEDGLWVAVSPSGTSTLLPRSGPRSGPRRRTSFRFENDDQEQERSLRSAVSESLKEQRLKSGARLVSTAKQKERESRRLTGLECVACRDPIKGSGFKAPCDHCYDIDCLLELFTASTKDESLYPPRCCRKIIPIQSVKPLMSTAAFEYFVHKGIEFGTVNRVYCCNPSCSRFLGPQKDDKKARFAHCPAAGCGTVTCTKCRTRVTSRFTHECQVDEGDKAALALGKRAGWARCPGCAQLIELNLGCFHMTCRCKTEFCYVCLAKWKTCNCPQWEQNNLVNAAEARVGAIDDSDEEDEDQDRRRRLLRRAIEDLRQDHDCAHNRWGLHVKFRTQCAVCHRVPPIFNLWRCRNCTMLACNRCRRNRL